MLLQSFQSGSAPPQKHWVISGTCQVCSICLPGLEISGIKHLLCMFRFASWSLWNILGGPLLQDQGMTKV